MSAALVVWGLGLYILFALVIAFLARSGKAASLSDYFLAGRSLGGVVSALSYSATTYSAFMLVGLAGLTYRGGVGALGFELVYLSGMVLVAFFGPRFWLVGKKFGYVTPPEMLGDRYGSRGVAVIAALASCLFLIPYCAVQLAGVGYLLEGMTGGAVSFTAGAVLATVLAVLLAWIAGMRSVAWTDAFQSLVMILTATAVVLVVVSELGGFGGLFSRLEAEKPELLTVPGNGFFSFSTFVGLTLPWFFFSISNPQVSQRLFMPKSLVEMRRMLIIFLGFGLVYTLVSVLWGFSAAVRFPSLASPDLATPTLLSSGWVPPLLGVIVMVGIMAAAISTVDSILLTLSSIVARDLYGSMGKERDPARQLRAGLWVIPLIALLSYLFASLKLNLIAVLAVSSSAGLLVMVPSVLGAFFWKRGTSAGVLASILGGGITVIWLEWTQTRWFGQASGVWGLAFSLLLFVGVSLLTKPAEEPADRFLGYLRGALKERNIW
ncbi:SSS family solute:Na+ symporter [Melghirimyces profundicolus]|uniref:SSS family solute:Na+ symporter n=1 Tax=Melghirimyces profundicolus TaxID=1242148 RepID=A0A2T6BW20_9BACL|nr:sodium:solute symporter family protein [Melghirimyces profundicolus]PTX60265.1 SSS family solute:Na+ symporter [Melghirimyces profundicolus]